MVCSISFDAEFWGRWIRYVSAIARPQHRQQPSTTRRPLPPLSTVQAGSDSLIRGSPRELQNSRQLQKTQQEDLKAKIFDLVTLGVLMGLWYASNIVFNIYNKQVLTVFPSATIATFIHLLVGSVIMGALWLTKLKNPVVLTRRTIGIIVPLAFLHMGGFLTTNMSLGSVNVSLTHTIKSLEPFFTVVLSWFFLGSAPTALVMVSLLPIVVGVIVASATDLSFSWYGFIAAMASNVCFQVSKGTPW